MQQFYTNYSMVTDMFESELIFKVKVLITVHMQVTLFEYLQFIVTYSCAVVCPPPPKGEHIIHDASFTSFIFYFIFG